MPKSVLVIDLGSVHTRANLFDVVDGRYNFIAAGMVPTTVNAPFRDLGESVYASLDQLSEVTGRKFVNLEHQLILPADRYGAGVDRVVLTLSTDPELRIVSHGITFGCFVAKRAKSGVDRLWHHHRYRRLERPT